MEDGEDDDDVSGSAMLQPQLGPTFSSFPRSNNFLAHLGNHQQQNDTEQAKKAMHAGDEVSVPTLAIDESSSNLGCVGKNHSEQDHGYEAPPPPLM